MDMKRFLIREESRKNAYRLLSTCYRLPDTSVEQSVAELMMALDDMSPEAATAAAKMTTIPNLELLAIDFSSLFVGPFKLLAPPYGSVYLEGKREVMGASTVDARNQYKAAGLDFSEDMKEAPDHIAIELEFMYYLIFKEIEAIEQNDPQSAIDYSDKQAAFLSRHLGRWVDSFAESVHQNADTDFYRNLAIVTKLFVQTDLIEVSKSLISQLAVTAQE